MPFDVTELNLTEDQWCAIQKIQKFLDQDDSPAFLLEGMPGVGKTTLVNYIIKKYYMQGLRTCVSAYTNKATNIIKQKTPYADSLSLFRLLGLKVDETSEKLVFENKLKENFIKLYAYIVVDEVSMVEDYLIDLIISECEKWGIKVIFVGDKMQLPPVSDAKDSKAFDIKPSYELTKIVRQSSDSQIPYYCAKIRKFIQKINLGEKIPIRTKIPLEDLENSDTKDVHLFKDSKQFLTEILDLFNSEDYRQNTDLIKVIGYRNKTVSKTNAIIRKSIFKETKEPLIEGEDLMVNQASYDARDFANNEKPSMNVYDTSDEVKIIKILETKIYDQYHLGIKIVFPYCVAIVRRKYDGREAILNLLYPNYKDVFEKFMGEWIKEIKKQHNKKELFRYSYYPFLKKFTKVAYNYAITSHSSQSSTFGNVYVVEDDIENVSANAKLLWQSKYVSCSRSSKKLCLLNRFED